MSTVVWIVIVVVALLLIAAIVAVVGRAIHQRRTRKAERIREDVRHDAAKIERREAIAQETAAKARAAQAEADVKTAEAARLQERADDHQHQVTTAREELDEKWQRADRLDPQAKSGDDHPDEADDERAREAADQVASSHAAEPFTRSTDAQ
jgi:NADH dehydrogenase/NADH:ubiquinone oxidoreductase subunit G